MPNVTWIHKPQDMCFGLVLELKIFGNALGFSNLVLLVYSLLFLTCYGK